MRAALSYAGRGIPVFPCEPAAKRPLTPGGFWDATTDPYRVRGWWGRWPLANIAIPTGRRSGLVVLDIDERSGGMQSFALLEHRQGPAPRTARSRTGGGGEHLFFRYPAGKEVRNSAALLGPGLDVRGEGGYVIVPPSRTQRPYEWTDRSPPADVGWLLGCLSEYSEQTLF